MVAKLRVLSFRISQTRLVVVDLPCVPAIDMSWISFVILPKSSGYEKLGIFISIAFCLSLWVFGIASE
jgi:hypothetical protein